MAKKSTKRPMPPSGTKKAGTKKRAPAATKKARRPRILVFMLAYNAEKSIASVFERIPMELQDYETSVLVIDDASRDDTFERAIEYQRGGTFPFPLTILQNPVNQGYGGNVKIGMHYAIENDFDVICLIHADGQYAPEKLPELLVPLVAGEADVVFGSRMIRRRDALKGGMPLYKWVGNQVLTWFENRVLGVDLSEFHTGLRLYSTQILRGIPFDKNSQVFHFDTEIIIQLINAKARINEIPIPTFYGDEVSHVNGLVYAWNVAIQAILARAQRLNLCYQRKFDLSPRGREADYRVPKTTFSEVHQKVVDAIPAASRVLDISPGDGLVAQRLRAKGCHVTGIDRQAPQDETALDTFLLADIEVELPVELDDFDVILLLDVAGHLHEPEKFLDRLHQQTRPEQLVFASSGNVGFMVNRLQLLFGYFNYGKRGILDPGHSRLFTFSSFGRLWEEAGFDVRQVSAVAAPFDIAFGDGAVARFLAAANSALLHLSKGMFGYRILIEAQPRPTLDYLLNAAYSSSGVEAGGTNDGAARADTR